MQNREEINYLWAWTGVQKAVCCSINGKSESPRTNYMSITQETVT